MSFVASKIVWMLVAPGNFLLFLLLLGGFLSVSHHVGKQKLGRKIGFYTALAMFFIAVLPVGEWLLLPLENDFPPTRPAHVDGIILLGGDENARISEARKQPTVLDSARRYIMFATLAREYPEARLIYSGGSGRLVPSTTLKEAEIARQSLAGLGVPVDRITFEDQSRNTRENAVMSAAIAHPTPQQNWLLVTSAFHMPRAMGCFRKAGWHVFPATTGYETDGRVAARPEFSLVEHLRQMALALHEYYGLVAYWLMGYIDSPWPE